MVAYQESPHGEILLFSQEVNFSPKASKLPTRNSVSIIWELSREIIGELVSRFMTTDILRMFIQSFLAILALPGNYWFK